MKQALAFLVRATTPADRLVLIGVWGGLGLLMAQTLSAPPAEEAVIQVRGEVVKRLELDQEGTITVRGPLGPSTLRVQDGAIRFGHSPCSRKRCLRRGWLTQSGEAAACVPNRILVRLAGSSRKPWDAVNY